MEGIFFGKGAEVVDDARVQGIITNIQHFSMHDGPGIRTIVFLKGCPLRCAWCSNPETQSFAPELGMDHSVCPADCSRCAEACPSRLPCRDQEGKMRLDSSVCRGCAPLAEGEAPCAAACLPRALKRYGEKRSVAEVLDAVEEDSVFYQHEQGGLTLSGGEALAQPLFALALLREAKRRCLHACIETCGQVEQRDLLAAGALLDYVLFDIKHMDDARHRQGVGVGNARILENLQALRAAFPNLPIRVRTPVIPGFNATPAAIAAIARQAGSLGGPTEYEMLPYHAYGTGKYALLGRPCLETAPPSEELMAHLREVARAEATVK